MHLKISFSIYNYLRPYLIHTFHLIMAGRKTVVIGSSYTREEEIKWGIAKGKHKYNQIIRKLV